MKKIYLPILFIISFVYSKIAFNEFKFGPSNNIEIIAARSPASELNSSAQEDYAKQEQNLLLASYFDNSLEFFLKEIGSKNNSNLNTLIDFQGSIIGNPNVMSFGFWIDDKGRAFLGVKDPKEIGYGQFSHDVLRHYVSAKIINKNISWKKYYQAYADGVLKQPHQNSFYVEKGLESVYKSSKEYFFKNISLRNDFKFLHIKSTQKLKEKEKTKITNFLKKYFAEAIVYDIVTLPGKKGYHISWRLYPHGKVEWYQLEEMHEGVYSKVFPEKVKVGHEDRFHQIQEEIYNSRLNDSLFYILLNEKSYLLKPVGNYSDALSWAEIPEDDYEEVVLDQAYAIGAIHRYSLIQEDNELSRYLDAWKKIPANEFEEMAIDLKYKIYDAFKNDKKN